MPRALAVPRSRSNDESRAMNIFPSQTVLVAAFPWTLPNTQFSMGATGMLVDIDFTDITGGTNVTFTINYFDEASRAYVAGLAGAAITADNTHQRLQFNPDAVAAANAIVVAPPPRQWNITAVQTGGITSATFSIGVSYW